MKRDQLDPTERNDPLKPDKPGETYAAESGLIHAPAPITNGVALDTCFIVR